MITKDQIALVIGNSRGLGFHVIDNLISQGYKVRVIARNRRNAQNFLKEKINELESLFECDLYQEAKHQQSKFESNSDQINSILDLAFSPTSKNIRVAAVISALGGSKNSNETKIIEENSIRLLIKLCQKHGVKNFIFLSSYLVTQPHCLNSYLLNTFCNNILVHKVAGENALRNSDLNYLIIRPANVVDYTQEKYFDDYKIEQNKNVGGVITKSAVGKLILDAMQCTELANRLTIECVGQRSGDSKNQSFEFKGKELKSDELNFRINPSHLKTKQTYHLIFLSLFILLMSFYFLFF